MFYLFRKHFDRYISLWNGCLFELKKKCNVFSSGFHCSHYRVTDEACLAETSKKGPSTFLGMYSLLLKERTFVFLFGYLGGRGNYQA